VRKEISMPLSKLIDYLDSNNIKYIKITHSPAYTAQEVAASAHIPGRQLAKTVMVKLDGKMTMVILPAPAMVDLNLLKQAAVANNAELAQESEFKDLFPGCEVGAEPPFGNLYGMEVYVATSLSEDEDIAFNAGSHTELIRLAYDDFARLVEPKVAPLSQSDEH
jgi:Ala-tRNA(Pro) deacylase